MNTLTNRTFSKTPAKFENEPTLLFLKTSKLHPFSHFSPTTVPAVPEGRQPLYKTTAHWSSIYDHFNGVSSASQPYRAQRPEWTKPKTAYSSTRGCYEPEYESRFGKYGDNPRTQLPKTASKMSASFAENTYLWYATLSIDLVQRKWHLTSPAIPDLFHKPMHARKLSCTANVRDPELHSWRTTLCKISKMRYESRIVREEFQDMQVTCLQAQITIEVCLDQIVFPQLAKNSANQFIFIIRMYFKSKPRCIQWC